MLSFWPFPWHYATPARTSCPSAWAIVCRHEQGNFGPKENQMRNTSHSSAAYGVRGDLPSDVLPNHKVSESLLDVATLIGMHILPGTKNEVKSEPDTQWLVKMRT